MLEPRQIRSLTEALATSDDASRWEAVRALKHAENPNWAEAPADVIKPLVDALKHQLPKKGDGGMKCPPLYRQEVTAILGAIGPRAAKAVPQLIELLDSSEAHGVREAAATALGKIGKEATSAIDPLLGVLDAECRVSLAIRVARALGDIGVADKRVQTALNRLWLVTVTCPASRLQIAVALCQLKCDAPNLIANLTQTLVGNQNLALRTAAVEALSWGSKSEIGVVPALTAALYDEDETIRALAAAALERLRVSSPKAIQICAQQLKDCVHAETALRRSGTLGVPALIEALKDAEPSVREKAAKTLGAIGEPAATAAAALETALRDRYSEVRLSAAKALWNVKKQPDGVVTTLADLLGGKINPVPADSELRRRFIQSVVEALGRIGAPARAAVPALKKLIKDDNRLIRESATRTLRQIDPAKV